MKLWSFGKKNKEYRPTNSNKSIFLSKCSNNTHSAHIHTQQYPYNIWTIPNGKKRRRRQQQRPKRKITKRQINVDRPMQDKERHTNTQTSTTCRPMWNWVCQWRFKNDKKNRRNEIDEASFFPCKCLLLKMILSFFRVITIGVCVCVHCV